MYRNFGVGSPAKQEVSSSAVVTKKELKKMNIDPDNPPAGYSVTEMKKGQDASSGRPPSTNPGSPLEQSKIKLPDGKSYTKKEIEELFNKSKKKKNQGLTIQPGITGEDRTSKINPKTGKPWTSDDFMQPPSPQPDKVDPNEAIQLLKSNE